MARPRSPPPRWRRRPRARRSSSLRGGGRGRPARSWNGSLHRSLWRGAWEGVSASRTPWALAAAFLPPFHPTSARAACRGPSPPDRWVAAAGGQAGRDSRVGLCRSMRPTPSKPSDRAPAALLLGVRWALLRAGGVGGALARGGLCAAPGRVCHLRGRGAASGPTPLSPTAGVSALCWLAAFRLAAPRALLPRTASRPAAFRRASCCSNPPPRSPAGPCLARGREGPTRRAGLGRRPSCVGRGCPPGAPAPSDVRRQKRIPHSPSCWGCGGPGNLGAARCQAERNAAGAAAGAAGRRGASVASCHPQLWRGQPHWGGRVGRGLGPLADGLGRAAAPRPREGPGGACGSALRRPRASAGHACLGARTPVGAGPEQPPAPGVVSRCRFGLRHPLGRLSQGRRRRASCRRGSAGPGCASAARRSSCHGGRCRVGGAARSAPPCAPRSCQGQPRVRPARGPGHGQGGYGWHPGDGLRQRRGAERSVSRRARQRGSPARCRCEQVAPRQRRDCRWTSRGGRRRALHALRARRCHPPGSPAGTPPLAADS